MKIFKLLIFISLLPSISKSQIYEWSQCIGCNLNKSIAGELILDNDNNVIVTGWFEGAMDMDPGVGQTWLISNGYKDAFVTKYSSSGTHLWSIGIGGVNSDYGYSVVTDDSSNVFVVGEFYGTVDFDPGPGITNLTSLWGLRNFFLVKYNSQGVLQWVKIFGGSATSVIFPKAALKLDHAGNIFVAGTYSQSSDFDPGPNVHVLTFGGSSDIFIEKFNSAGEMQWVKGFGADGTDECNGLALDDSANIYITGIHIGDSIDFNPGGVNGVLFGGPHTGFLTKYDSAGTFKFLCAMHDFECRKVITHSSGIYLTGERFPGYGAFVTKLNYTWNILWTIEVDQNNTGTSRGFGMDVDNSSNVYFTGDFSGTADFDPGPGAFNLIETDFGNYPNTFLAKYNSFGDLQWALSIGVAGSDIGRAINLDNNGNLFTAGGFQKEVDFDPGPDTASLISPGTNNPSVYVAKYSFGVSPVEYISSSNNNTFHLFPNPSSGNFAIRFNEFKPNTRIEIYNSIGELLYSNTFLKSAKENYYPVSFTPESGIYFVRVSDGVREQVQKLVVR